MKAALLAFASTLAVVPAHAQIAQDPLAPLPQQQPAPVAAVPVAPVAPEPLQPVAPASVQATPAPVQAAPPPAPVPAVRVPRSWAEVFAAIRSRNWAVADAGIRALPRSALTPVAKAELYTARGSPVVSLGQIHALLAEAPELPQAEQLVRLAQVRGATAPLAYYPKKPLVWLGNAPTRSRARAVAGEPAADQLRAALDPLVKNNDAPNAELLLMQNVALLSYEARAEAGQRVAWTYYAIGRDADARRVADAYRFGARGDWATQSAWVSGLASWRMGDCNAASRAFQEVATRAVQRELSAGGYYWAARAEQACRRPQAVARFLRAAANSPESFYGLLARETLGTQTRLPPDPHSHAAQVGSLPNVRRAAELVAIGEHWLAEQMLRHQAAIGNPAEHHGLIEFAKSLDLAGAQYWLAHNGQRGAVVDAHDRYPMPRWNPPGGWRVDPALALAHIRQESQFRADVVSPAGAVGLMQVMPQTATDMARINGLPYGPAHLTNPVINMEFGQAFLERMRGSTATQGHLPKIIAAYNAGPLPVARWSYTLPAGDPVLWIESIPYWETRYYVPAVFRNLWVYQGLTGAETETLSALAQHRWPAFPTSPTRIASAEAPDVTPAGER